MNVIKCKNGHFFDGDTYQVCPHCGEDALPDGGANPPKDEKKSLFGHSKKGKKDKSISPLTGSPNSPTVSLEDFGRSQVPTENMRELQTQPTTPLKSGPTLDFWHTSSQNGNVEDARDVPNVQASHPAVPQSNGGYGAPAIERPVETPIAPKATAVTYNESNGSAVKVETSLLEAVRNASASNDGKTMSYFNIVAAPTEQMPSIPKCSAEPVVGWLVCVKGSRFGESFSVFAGKNSIGRSAENRIVIEGDNSISREKHALIVFEPKKRNFYLQPGDSSGLTYLNDEYITESHIIVSHDMIELGDCKFLFVPLCGEDFTWEDFISKGE